MSVKNRAVFLDRDGVINRAEVYEGKPFPPASVADLEILPGVVDALNNLKKSGFLLIVVSNQPDVSRGKTRRVDVESINNALTKQLPIDRFIMCYHDTSDGCDCRKPLPGMLLEGAREFDVDLTSSYMVGDRWRDMEAGVAARCKTVFIDYGYDEKQPEICDYRVTSLADWVSFFEGSKQHNENYY